MMWSWWVNWVNWLECVDAGLYIVWNWLVTSSAYRWLAYSCVPDRFMLMWSILQFYVVNSVLVLCTFITMLHLPFYIFKVEGCYVINVLVSVAKVMGGWLTQVWLNLQVKWNFLHKAVVYRQNEWWKWSQND